MILPSWSWEGGVLTQILGPVGLLSLGAVWGGVPVKNQGIPGALAAKVACGARGAQVPPPPCCACALYQGNSMGWR